MDINVEFRLFQYFALFFWFSNMILSDALTLPVSQVRHSK